ncbi:MAG TPA: CDF family Co(II)/Ni(II) efflux transporter DmeF [Alphaproteobacteria bacterium]|nr:CDF family Co(II)/Ni(II) efflux transporter DmeF [Alphaproteobacteria bacterium]
MSHTHCSQTTPINADAKLNEKRTRAVALLTAAMMVAEIIGGQWFGSMALLADGFHMATHVGALGIAAFAYAYARKHANDPRYSFGTGKVGDLAGFTSAIILGVIAIYVLFESVGRLINPIEIVYGEAIAIAALGFLVNVASAGILHGGDSHSHHHHDHNHAHEHAGPHHHDHNFRAAYIHVIADAVTSVLAVVALACGWIFGWRWADPAIGIVGAFVIISWALTLIRDSSGVLLDRTQDECGVRVRDILTRNNIEVIDLHVWRVGQGCNAAIVAVKAPATITVEQVRNMLQPLNFSHVTVEINQA